MAKLTQLQEFMEMLLIKIFWSLFDKIYDMKEPCQLTSAERFTSKDLGHQVFALNL